MRSEKAMPSAANSSPVSGITGSASSARGSGA